MNPGRELDALISEKIFGMKVTVPSDNGFLPMPPHYSTNIRAAWEVFEKVARMVDDPWAGFVFDGKKGVWRCHFDRQTPGGVSERGTAISDTAPHAICLAALKAVGAI